MNLIRVTNTHMLKVKGNDIFKSYPDIDYVYKLCNLNRLLIQYFDEGKLVGVAVVSKKDRFLKLNLMIVHPKFRRAKIATMMLKVILNFLRDDFCDADTLYTVCPRKFDTNDYQGFLIKNGFQLSTIKANGEAVYTYAKSVQESTR